jgi:hypothetical protein
MVRARGELVSVVGRAIKLKKKPLPGFARLGRPKAAVPTWTVLLL